MATEPIARLLRQSPDLAPVRDRLEQVGRLQDCFRSVVPAGLASTSRVCAVDGTTVVVRADNAPVAAALRALAPRLLAGLKQCVGQERPPPGKGAKSALKIKRDQELTALRVEVQVEAPAAPRKVRERKALPMARLAEVAEGLAESPLKEVLERITRGHRKTSTRPKR